MPSDIIGGPRNRRKSSYSGGGDCVEVRVEGGAVRVGDSKAPNDPGIPLTPDEFAGLITAVKEL